MNFTFSHSPKVSFTWGFASVCREILPCHVSVEVEVQVPQSAAVDSRDAELLVTEDWWCEFCSHVFPPHRSGVDPGLLD